VLGAWRKVRAKTKAILNFAVLVIFITCVIVAYQLPAIKAHLSKEEVGSFVKGFGIWGPLIAVILITVGEMTPIPGLIFTLAAAILFGPVPAFIYTTIGSNIGSVLCFWISRKLGRDFARRFTGDGLKKYERALVRNGFATSLYLRLTFVPSPIVNYGSGLTSMRFRDYLWGTIIGHLPSQLVLIIVLTKLVSGDVAGLLTWPVILTIALFVFSFFIPTLIRRLEKRRRRAARR
jgi:uncharacterized membrane protein YdjX (TVP38/TMEM64 family)